MSKDILKQGHEIGNHSYSHPYFTKISTAEMKSEVKKTHDIILRITGKAPAPLFRPPYGNYNSDVLKASGEIGYSHTIMWSTDTLDWKGIPAESIINRVLDNAKPGAIVLMHVGSGIHTPEALPIIIEKLHSMGYKLTTVSNMLSKDNPSPTGKTYTVAPGDTLWKIASMFGVTGPTWLRSTKYPTKTSFMWAKY